jgi:hypothetical protein
MSLPPNFGEIDVTAPFDPHRYFTMLRWTGANPYLWRHGEQRVLLCCGFNLPIDLQRRRFLEAVAWKNAQDNDSSIQKSFVNAIVAAMPDGNFKYYLGHRIFTATKTGS